ncbi:pectate lyase family protein [Micromonospora deserti]|uniref:Pectate lyase n=1 Tax=Micromonospora deserti TaxID=2070366 RepID=A0A2W2CVT9_9ACTN|nr:pectate lyase [Micromonospora deserti]PZG02633.1 pectate lyase [Micromonospora deserti]
MAGGTTGGAGGRAVTVTDGATLVDLLESNERLVIRVQGMITMPDEMNDVHSNKTIIGVGANSGFRGGGLNISSGYHNIIVRNLAFTGWTSDAIEVEGQAHHIWVDHNRFAGAGGGADGSVDIKHGSDYITVSWNHTTHDKNMLLGHDDDNTSDRGRLRVTYHHNWFDGSAERNPRVRYGNPVHVFNNYYDNNEIYGVASTVEAGVLVEGNYFENVPRPIAVGYADSPPGNVVQRNNLFVGSGPVESTGTGVNSIPYGYPLDNATNVPATVMAGAGTGKIG